MAVKLYDGCYGVTRKHAWVSPADRVKGPFIASSSGLGFHLGNPLNWYSDNGLHCSRWMLCQVIAVFPTEAKARAHAHADRKPWCHRRWPVLPFILAALAVAAWFILLGCGVPAGPVQNNCETQAWSDSLSRWEWIPCNNTEKNAAHQHKQDTAAVWRGGEVG